ncbi:DNA primase [plant metagenome]|uniref:DNA primase n=1 Tax=plant metagenome TaxID=1297885 RepID=A0A484SCT7_9ZZZZ
MIPDSFIQELLARVDIAEVVGRYVQLRKGGANLLGLCPFHNEKSPSFTVSPVKQFYHCFGCGAHGSAITFLMEHTGASFPEAVRSLASTVGLSVPEENRSPRQQAEDARRREEVSRHSQMLEMALAHYRKSLKQSPTAIRYLQERGLTGTIAAQFGLGWADADRQGLAKVFPRYDDPLLVEAGLVIESEDGRRYDRFRDRVMFPIRNARGHLIGFGGRVIGKGEPKYLNSPETPIFSKGNELYGLWEGRLAVRSEGQVVVVEGYMDVVGLAQQGVGNAVATLGTATTPTHVQKLLRASDKVVFSFDGDKAGRRAAWRALQACLPLLRDDISIRFLFLPDDHDPDSYVRAFGPEAFRACLDEAVALSRFLLDELASRHDLSEVEGRAACVHEAKPLLLAVPEGTLRLQLQHELARQVLLTSDELAGILAAAGPGPGAKPAPGRPSAPAAPASPAGQGAGDHGELPPPWEGGMVVPDDPDMGWQPADSAGDEGYYGGYPDAGSSSGYGGGQAQQGQGYGKGGGGRRNFGDRKDRGEWKGKGRGRDEGPPSLAPPPGRRPVTSLAKRLLRLLLSHPELVDEMGEQQLEVLDKGPHLHLVRDLVVLAQASGARHLGALLQAAEPDSDLALVLQQALADVMAQAELPEPQVEWEDALRRIELDALRIEQSELVRGGLTDPAAKAHYLELSQRITVLNKPSAR